MLNILISGVIYHPNEHIFNGIIFTSAILCERRLSFATERIQRSAKGWPMGEQKNTVELFKATP
jgi:hypothetical protein